MQTNTDTDEDTRILRLHHLLRCGRARPDTRDRLQQFLQRELDGPRAVEEDGTAATDPEIPA